MLQANPETKKIEKKCELAHSYPATKIMWIPTFDSTKPDVVATSGDCLRIWRIEDNQRVTKTCDLPLDNYPSNSKNGVEAPITSFDWSERRLDTIIACSIDTTCSIWDIQCQTLVRRFIAHEKQVFDISISHCPKIFATVSSDRTLRQFDSR